MALTRITKGVIKPNENYDTHDINSTGIITATKFDGPFDSLTVSGNMSIGGVLTYEDVTNIDSIGIITARNGLIVSGVTTTAAVSWGGHMLPTSNAAYDIGSADYKVRHLFLSDNSLKFVDSSDTEHPLSVDSGRLKFAGGMLLGNNIKMDTTSGIITATNFAKADGSSLGGIESDSMLNTVAGTLSGDSITNSGVSGTSGTENTLYGYSAGRYIALGDGNTCFGVTAGRNLGGGSWNTFLGWSAGRLMSTSNNTCIGYQAGETNNSQGSCVALGYEASRNASNAARFTALGYQAGKAHTGGNGNTYVGYQAGYLNTAGDNNVILGDQGVHNSSDFNRVTVIGASAAGGFGSNANDNTVIGYNAGGSTLTGSNNIIIGSGANPSGNVSNEITLGDANITNFRIPGVHIGITANSSSLPAPIFRPGVIQETFHNYTSAITGTYDHDILSYGMVWNGTANASGAFTFNIRGDASTTFNSLTSSGKVTTMTIYSTNNNASNYMSAFQIDGSTQTVKWAGGSAPSAATGSGVDVYSMTIMKTAANTYHVYGNVTNFA